MEQHLVSPLMCLPYILITHVSSRFLPLLLLCGCTRLCAVSYYTGTNNLLHRSWRTFLPLGAAFRVIDPYRLPRMRGAFSCIEPPDFELDHARPGEQRIVRGTRCCT